MDLGLTGKVALVTGGSKGIGLACARMLADEGARIAIASRDEDNLKKAAADLSGDGHDIVTVQADLTDPDDASRMAAQATEALGPIDVLVNSAGAARRVSPEKLTPADWHHAMDAKYFTYIHAMSAVLSDMAARGSGAIVNVVGAGGKLATPTHLTGGGANAALMLVSAGLANAHAPNGVRINAINPGLTLTDRVKQAAAAEAALHGITPEEGLEQIITRAPLGRLATPEEVASVVTFVASDKASYLTGAVINLDGAATPTVI